MDLEYIKRVGIAAAYKGVGVLRAFFGRIREVNKKGAIDLVTAADTTSEKVIIETIKMAFPDHAILAEESGMNGENTRCQWIIDPLDGTTNFTHQLGLFSISIAFSMNFETIIGIVLNPVSGELFTAMKGKGAELNGQPIHVSAVNTVSDSLLVTGFPYDRQSMIEPLVTRLANCMQTAQGIRRLGSAALDLCFIACGRFDGYWEQNLNPWDTAAGVLIGLEAGAVVTDFSDKPFTPDKKEILATNGKIHKEMLTLLTLKDTI